jgi:hypothetical protein
MFKKLNTSPLEIDTDRLKNSSTYSRATLEEFSINDREYLFTILDNQFQFNIAPRLINVTEIVYPGIKPHTDSFPVSMNFYFDVGGDETCFWKNVNLKESPLMGFKRSHSTEKDLQKIGSFIANKGDCYLLDVSNIHSVNISTPNTARKILRLCWWDYSFDEILESIKLKNNF